MNFLIYFIFQVWSYRGLSESDLRHLLSSLGKFLLMAIQFDSLGSASSFPVKFDLQELDLVSLLLPKFIRAD